MPSPSRTLASLAEDLGTGATTSRKLIDQCLDRISRDQQAGAIFLHVDADAARAAGAAIDNLRAACATVSPYAGIPVSIKDLFDIAGQTTRAGSRVLDKAPPAPRDAEAVRRLRAAGFVVLGRTNMTEFAFSGLGLNPHYGTPDNPWQDGGKRIPGGSTSGGAISVAKEMAHLALGTDTGGSCRIPAAFNALVGFKPSAYRMPSQGVLPLSTSLDSIGSIGRSVRCCVIADAVLSGMPEPDLSVRDIRGRRFVVPTNYVMEGTEAAVAAAFEASLSILSERGAVIERRSLEFFDRIPVINAKGGLTAAESYAWHRKLLATAADQYDPRVSERLQRGATQDAADYIETFAARAELVAEAARFLEDFDALLMPTVPVVPPKFSEVEDPTDYGRINLLVLRNSTTINMVDGCAFSLPISTPGAPPVGLTVASSRGRDRHLMRIAANVENALARLRH